MEESYTCDKKSPSSCWICGDGMRGGTEACDDGNVVNGFYKIIWYKFYLGDGCSDKCKIEENFVCNDNGVGSRSIC